MNAGAHPAMAAAFLRWLEDSPHWQPPPMSTDGMTERDKREVTSAALLAVAGMAGGGSTDSVMERDAARFDRVGWPANCGRIAGMTFPAVRFLFGNGRFAYAAVSSDARTSGGSVACGGALQSFLVLRKRDERWEVLLLTPNGSLEDAVRLADQFDRLGLTTASGDVPVAPRLISPLDGERQTRFPKQDVSWQQDVSRPVAYVVESRFGQPSGSVAGYSPSSITVVAAVDYGDIVRMPMPFGVGMQPHRWRVWAIGSDGKVAVSEWRTVNFTN
jgi:hypothetical protein